MRAVPFSTLSDVEPILGRHAGLLDEHDLAGVASNCLALYVGISRPSSTPALPPPLAAAVAQACLAAS